MLDKERGAQAIGIPQVTRTPGKFFDVAKFIREEILGKPTPEKLITNCSRNSASADAEGKEERNEEDNHGNFKNRDD